MTEVHIEALEDEDFDTILSEDIDFTGVLRCEKAFLIRGRVSGEIVSQGLLVIDEDAVVEANIKAQRVIIKGTSKGDVAASDKVEITVTGQLHGNVIAPEMFMETGCVFNGRCTMVQRAAEI
jgi:cytoskeletal protein CcmA (bactofilin family)